jgi:hypothetical protein
MGNVERSNLYALCAGTSRTLEHFHALECAPRTMDIDRGQPMGKAIHPCVFEGVQDENTNHSLCSEMQ